MPSYVKCITGDKPPKNAVQAGYDDGPSYHARGVVNGLTIPGKVGVRSEKDLHLVGACIPYGSKEHRVNSFEVLTDDKSAFTYVRCQTWDRPPKNAVQGGFDGGPSYHARGEVRGKLIPGKAGVQGTSTDFYLKGACFPYASREYRINNYEVLVEADYITHVDFHLDKGKMLATKPMVLARQEYSNRTSRQQTKEFSFKKTTTHTSTFTHQWGSSITQGAKFTCSLPEIFGGEISMGATRSINLTWGESKAIGEEIIEKCSVVAEAHTTVMCELLVNETSLQVPYTMHFKSGEKSGGMWNGVLTWDVKTTYEEIKL